MNNFKKAYGPWALITGATTGIGYETTIQLAAQGLNIIAVARNELNLITLKNKLEKEYSIKVEILAEDLSKIESSEILNKKLHTLMWDY